MHLDLAHALVTGVLILFTLWGLRVAGLRREERRWDWNVFIAVFIVVAILNILWPAGSP